MKGPNIKSPVGVRFIEPALLLCLVLIFPGCITIPNSPTPRFYALLPIKDVGAVSVSAHALIIGIGPVKIPEYLDRPQIVTTAQDKTLQFAQFDRWGESLDLGLARLIREDLTAIMPKAKWTLYPWIPSIAVKYQVAVELVQLDSKLDGDMFFVVQWTIIDVQNSKAVLIKRSEFREPINPHNYTGLAQTLSTACATLSHQIAAALNFPRINHSSFTRFPLPRRHSPSENAFLKAAH